MAVRRLVRSDSPHRPRERAPLILRRAPASLTPASYDASAGTIEAVISTGFAGLRTDGRGVFREALNLAPVDLNTLVGKPVQASHRMDADATVGVVVAVRREGENIVATIKLSDAADAASIRTKVLEGVLRAVSIGYRAASRTERIMNGERVVTIVPDIREISVVPDAFDPGAVIRSRTVEEDEIEIRDERPEADEMQSPLVITRRADGVNVVTWREGVEVDDVVEMLRTRYRDQRHEAQRQEIRRRAASQPRIRTAAPVEDPTIQRRAMEDALVLRMGGSLPDDEARHAAARPFMDLSIREHAKACCSRAGISTVGMSTDQLLRAAVHSTSDFAALLTLAGHRVFLGSYQAAPNAVKAVARQGTRPDFRSGSAIRLGEVGRLEKVGEGGEIKHTSRSEAVESYALDTYASMFTLSRQALINDDLGAFNDWTRAAGQAAASTEADLLWSLISQASGAGPIMGDGKRLFHADHGNLLTGTALSVDALSDARLAGRNQTGLDGKTRISATPKFLVVGPALETLAEKVLASIYAATTADANPFSQRLTLLVEPRITNASWYVFADPAQVPALEYSYLASAPGPQVSQRDGWDVLAREFRVFLDFGCGALDWRGAVRNPGA